MHRHPLRCLAAATLSGLAALALVGACAIPVSPLPPEASSATPSPDSPTPSAHSPPSSPASTPAAAGAAGPPRSPTPRRSSVCLGRVRYEIDASDDRAFSGSLCMTAGGILRVKHVGPGALSVTPSDHVDCAYEAAVHDCRLLKSGNVTFTIIVTSLPRSLVVVVIP